MEKETSRALSLIRWPLIMCIVAVHMFSTETLIVSGNHVNLEDAAMFSGLWLSVKAFLSENGVATFFFISGYLFFIGEKMTVTRYKSKIIRRIHSLFIPYMTWNLLAFLFVCFTQYFADRAISFDPTRFFSGFFMLDSGGYPHDAPMWFIRELIVCIALVPLVSLLFNKTGWSVVALLGVICFALYTHESDYRLLFTSAMFFFYFGGYLGQSNIDLLSFFNKWKIPCAILYPALSIAYMIILPKCYAAAMLIKCCNMIVVISLAINLAGFFVVRHNMTANRFLTGAAFFVFASHFIVLYHFKVAIMKIFHPTTDFGIVLTFIAGYFLLLGCLLGIYYLITKSAPRLASLLTGRR